MGRYINEDSKGNSIGTNYESKINNLIADGATKVSGDKFEPNLICVVNNGVFAAAAFAYSEREYEYFLKDGSGRPKTWLVHPKAGKLAK